MQIALFDLDHTLIPFDSGSMFTQHLASQGALPAGFEAQYLKSTAGATLAGTVDMVEMHRFTVGALGVHEPDVLAAWLREFPAVIAPRVLPAAQAMVAAHRDAGHVCALVTATSRIVAEACATLFGLAPEDVLATEIRPRRRWPLHRRHRRRAVLPAAQALARGALAGAAWRPLGGRRGELVLLVFDQRPAAARGRQRPGGRRPGSPAARHRHRARPGRCGGWRRRPEASRGRGMDTEATSLTAASAPRGRRPASRRRRLRAHHVMRRSSMAVLVGLLAMLVLGPARMRATVDEELAGAHAPWRNWRNGSRRRVGAARSRGARRAGGMEGVGPSAPPAGPHHRRGRPRAARWRGGAPPLQGVSRWLADAGNRLFPVDASTRAARLGVCRALTATPGRCG